MNRDILKSIVKIANYTHFNYETISNLSLFETNSILEIITELEQAQASVQLAIVDYQILLSRESDKNQAHKNQAQAQQIRGVLTGGKRKKQTNLGFFQTLGIYKDKKIL